METPEEREERQAFTVAYTDMLKDLKGPDKVSINTLSMLAGDNKRYLTEVVNAIVQHIGKVSTGQLLVVGGAAAGRFRDL